MDLNQHILAVVEPEIEPTEIKLVSFDEEKGGDKQSKTIASVAPMIQINGYTFQDVDIDDFTMNMSGILPKISVSLYDRKNAFGTDFQPRDGDCVTLFINSKNVDTFKAIHMDFEITDISTEAPTEDDVPTINVSGIAKIPRFFAEVCRDFPAGTSLDHLELIARDLKLGLATNIDATDDSQIRVQAFTPTSSFIEDIVDMSYVNDNSFQRYHIDQFYYLNFIELNKIFNSENSSIADLQESLASLPVSTGESGNTDETVDNIPAKLVLTNNTNVRGSNSYIHEYKLINNANGVSLTHGYERNVSYYDNNSTDEKLLEFNIQPQVSENLRDIDEPLKGRRGEDTYQEQVKYKYMGRMNAGEDGLGNVHPNALYTQLNNVQNNAELEKMKLKVTLESFNPSIYKYQKIPILIYQYAPEKIEAMKGIKDARKEAGLDNEPLPGTDSTEPMTTDEKPNQMLDNFLSGYYVIENINYEFDQDSGLVQHVTLLRREWPAKINDIGKT